ncbi:MAG: sterol 3beta-glucosyltransferase [Mycobacterium sp.]|nr:sterol 3beta-glucosyltransferase [Mycobacterium sp.]
MPAVGVPLAVDQPFWARRLRDLGVSSATIPQRRITADNLAAAVQKAMNDNAIRDNAKNLAARLVEEDGAGRVVAVVEGLLR